MITSFALPFLAAAVFGACAPRLAWRLRPGLAVYALSIGGMVLAAGCLLALALAGAAGLGRLPAVDRIAHWSPAAMSVANPFPPAVGAVAALLAAIAVARCLHVGLRGGRRLAAAWSVARSTPHDLVVSDTARPTAYAVPGWPGRIVVSRGLLASLDAGGRRAVLAHEQAHLAGRDDLHLFAASVVAALNPLLHRLPSAVDRACERRADEAAVRAVGDRRVVAGAIAIAVRPELATGVVLPAGGGDVAARVSALLQPRGRDLLPLWLPASLVFATGLSLLWLGHDLDNITDAARLLAR